jgi:hypothetical protein
MSVRQFTSRVIKKMARPRAAARCLIAGAVVTSGVLVAASAAQASWVQQQTPIVSGADTWAFSAVSCPVQAACTAVGSFSNNAGNHMLAERLVDGSWNIENVAPPSGGTGDLLNAVSCPSANVCTTVGSYFYNGTDTTGLAEYWDGAAFQLQTVPSPAGATDSQLTAVSCKSVNACIAVGTASTTSTTWPYAEQWNGSGWKVLTVPEPAGGSGGQLAGVSCTAANACTAVGGYVSGSVTVTLAEVWNGSTWTVQPTPSPSGSNFSFLQAVSCTSATSCVATGSNLAEGWNGTSWSLQTLAKLGGKATDMSSISCVSATACVAVGGYYLQGIQYTAAESWNGTKWASSQVPIGTSYDTAAMAGVACYDATTCTAVGFYHDPVDGYRPLVEDLALQWQQGNPQVPTGSIGSDFQGISCPAKTNCTAVGNFESSGGVFQPVVEQSQPDGQWESALVPDPTVTNLDAVSCLSATSCTAVGDLYNGTAYFAIGEQWNGTTWSLQDAPNPSGTKSSYLNAVSCTSATSCTAVGAYTSHSGAILALAESWNGTAWKITNAVDPASTTDPQLTGVSCAAANSCVATGTAEGGSDTFFAEAWNGSSWTLQSLPVPSGGSDSYVGGVSCYSTKACTAVGNYFNGTTTVPLAERWNGTAWTAQAPVGATGGDTYLSGVSCATVSSCMAVGTGGPGENNQSVAEYWNGVAWHLLPVAVPSGAQDSALDAVSCPVRTQCTASGWYTNSSGTELVMTQQYS